jgi:hypothetical protein
MYIYIYTHTYIHHTVSLYGILQVHYVYYNIKLYTLVVQWLMAAKLF